MSESITIARPYAQAAFEEAQKLGDLKSWSELLASLAEASANAEVAALIASPKIDKLKLADLMIAIAGSAAGVQQKNFIRVLADNQRLAVLPEIVAHFEMFRAEAEKTVNAVVESAFELSVAQQEKIASALKKRMGREIRLSCNVKQDLLGGVVIRAGDKVIDGSAVTRLGELATALA
jgi:F-type H+-transporting ATPase subunit delta